MKIKRRTRAILAVFLGLASSLSSSAQNRIAIEVEDPEFGELSSPEFGGGASKSWDAKDWLEMEVEFEVTNVDPSTARFVDNLTVKWYVGIKSPAEGNILLEKVVEHINVPVGEAMFSSVYLSPSAVFRISDKDRADKGIVELVGGEILFNGQRVALFSSKGAVNTSSPWWQSPNLSRYDKIPLRSKDETPFNYFWWDRYAENKVERR